MLNRRVTRVVLDGTEITGDVQDPNAGAASFVLTTSSNLYVGFFGKFASRHFQLGTANTNSTTVSVKTWDGDAFIAVEDVVDQTNGFQQSGFLHWQNPDDRNWKTTTISPVDDVELYWAKIEVSADLSAGTTLQSCLNLFSDDDSLRVYYPELITDSRFLPDSRTSFIDQHIAAKNEVILRLKQRKVIRDEDEIIDINEVSAATVHACARIILNPIDQDNELIARATAQFNNEINDLKKSADNNRDGVVSGTERDDLGFSSVLRR